METIFELLMKTESANTTITEKERSILSSIIQNRQHLKKRLSKKGKRLLLSLLDNEDLLCNETALRNFTAGFKMGVRIGVALDTPANDNSSHAL